MLYINLCKKKKELVKAKFFGYNFSIRRLQVIGGYNIITLYLSINREINPHSVPLTG
jgi:hypothetical protein